MTKTNASKPTNATPVQNLLPENMEYLLHHFSDLIITDINVENIKNKEPKEPIFRIGGYSREDHNYSREEN